MWFKEQKVQGNSYRIHLLLSVIYRKFDFKVLYFLWKFYVSAELCLDNVKFICCCLKIYFSFWIYEIFFQSTEILLLCAGLAHLLNYVL